MFDDSAQAGANAPRTTHHAPDGQECTVGNALAVAGCPKSRSIYRSMDPSTDDVHIQVSADAKGMC